MNIEMCIKNIKLGACVMEGGHPTVNQKKVPYQLQPVLSHRYNNPGMTILHEIVIKIKGKITEA